MADRTPKLYEGLFLMNQQAIQSDLQNGIDTIRGMLDRAGAEVIALGRWDERRLAYEIGGQKRGLFLLSMFRVDPVQIANIERDCNLAEEVMRVLMLRADHYGEAELAHIQQDTQAQMFEHDEEPEQEESVEDDVEVEEEETAGV